MENKNIISTEESSSATLTASSVKVHVQISGQSFFTGNEVLTKAIEVSTFISNLAEIGIDSKDVELSDIYAGTESGLLGKSSSATYDLIINCQKIEWLGRLVRVISSSKNIELTHLEWEYDEYERIAKDTLQKAVSKSKQTAQSICTSLGCQLISLHKLKYQTNGIKGDQPDFMPVDAMYAGVVAHSKKSRSVFSGWNINHKAEYKVIVTAEFQVSNFQ